MTICCLSRQITWFRGYTWLLMYKQLLCTFLLLSNQNRCRKGSKMLAQCKQCRRWHGLEWSWPLCSSSMQTMLEVAWFGNEAQQLYHSSISIAYIRLALFPGRRRNGLATSASSNSIWMYRHCKCTILIQAVNIELVQVILMSFPAVRT